MQIYAVTFKNSMAFDVYFNKQITRRAAIDARLAFTGVADAHTVFDTGGNVDFQCFVVFDFTFTVAGFAGFGNVFTGTVAGRASLLHREKAL